MYVHYNYIFLGIQYLKLFNWHTVIVHVYGEQYFHAYMQYVAVHTNQIEGIRDLSSLQTLLFVSGAFRILSSIIWNYIANGLKLHSLHCAAELWHPPS